RRAGGLGGRIRGQRGVEHDAVEGDVKQGRRDERAALLAEKPKRDADQGEGDERLVGAGGRGEEEGRDAGGDAPGRRRGALERGEEGAAEEDLFEDGPDDDDDDAVEDELRRRSARQEIGQDIFRLFVGRIAALNRLEERVDRGRDRGGEEDRDRV